MHERLPNYTGAVESVAYQESMTAEEELSHLLDEGEEFLSSIPDREEAERAFLETFGPRIDAAMTKAKIRLEDWITAGEEDEELVRILRSRDI